MVQGQINAASKICTRTNATKNEIHALPLTLSSHSFERAETEFEKNALKVHGGNTVYIHDLIKQYNYTLKKMR